MGTFFQQQLQLSRAKLKATRETSGLICGFALVSFVELSLIDRCRDDDVRANKQCTTLPDVLLVAFTVCTTLMVAVHLLALMISTCILPYIDIVATLGTGDSRDNLHSSKRNLSETPHIKMQMYIEAAWIMSNILGLFIFLVFMGLLSWIKFLDYSRNAAVGSTTILVPVLILFIAFALHFYYKLVAHKVKSAGKSLNEIAVGLEELQKYGSASSIYSV